MCALCPIPYQVRDKLWFSDLLFADLTCRIHLPSQIVICFIKPILPWRSPGVHFLDISNHEHFMREVGGNDDNIARIHIHYFFLVCPKPNAHLTRNKLRYLFMNVMVLGHEKTI